ncbi:MAG: Acetyl-CoA synthase corrinoid activation protein [Candidatus Jettenia ecosi]|uniref:Acetyl-CoA synthase corrinoid activation protein n=1 Tax=Candidatus Jettenia ecosi TaxID=2494326 RepID=A0A533QEQ5_9BACT|nr:MAG: Acetyl-CoA synthase corrinoid activation protein [Candidatus Jettenia ecosi]
MKNSQYKINFLPSEVTVDIEEGKTILDASYKGDLFINALCGGDGTCGKCKVILKSGKVDSMPTTHISASETKQGYVLACRTKVVDDLEVLIPEESRLDKSQILVSDYPQFPGSLASVSLGAEQFKKNPLVSKLYLELSHPSLDDSMADYERLCQDIMVKTDIPLENLTTNFTVLKHLPAILRNSKWKVTVTLGYRGSSVEVLEVQAGDVSANNYGVAVDVGTTTVVAHLLDLCRTETIDIEATYNSQIKYGDDYIQRIIHAEQHNAMDIMQEVLIEDINHLISTLVKRNKLSIHDIGAVVCAGNTVMTHFLVGLDPTNIRKEPYLPSVSFIPPLRAAEVGIKTNNQGLLYTLPCVGAYVGGDITSGVLAIRLDKAEALSLLIDIGTNGEIVLGNKDWMVCCSASAGPSFEGSGISCGMRAAKGAIEKINITKNFDVNYKTIGDTPPSGICGSGLLDCLATLVRSGVIDRTGNFQKGIDTDRLRKTDNGYEFILADKSETTTKKDIVITQADIQNLIRSKAAIYSAISTLIESMGMDINNIEQLYLAGGFGNYLDVRSAITIGMLPDISISKVQFVGNTSVIGAKMSLFSKDAYEVSRAIASKMTYFDLMNNNKYMEEYISANFLPHTDIEKFPSVAEELKVP